MFDVAIVGSGPAGVAAGLALRGLKVAIVDVGHSPPPMSIRGNFYEMLANGKAPFGQVIGSEYQSLQGVRGEPVMPKLKAPLFRFVTRPMPDGPGIQSDNFDASVSYAKGGLSNAWGAQLYRYDDGDLAEFPISADELAPFYSELTTHIGIAGRNDDLSAYYGRDESLLPAVMPGEIGSRLLKRYQQFRPLLRSAGISMGLPRLGVLTRPHRGRAPYRFENLDFFRPHSQSVYSAKITLSELIAGGHVEYLGGHYVEAVSETSRSAHLKCRLLAGGQTTIRAKRVLLGAGTLGSARLALGIDGNEDARLPLMENVISYIPFVRPTMIGTPHDSRQYYTQVNLCCERPEGMVMGTFYGLNGLLHSDLMWDVPLPTNGAIAALRSLAPAMLVLHLWYPSQIRPQNRVWRGSDGDLHIDYHDPVDGRTEAHLIRAMAPLGLVSAKPLVKFPRPGGAFHYAGCLPMRDNPQRGETGVDGRLFGSKRVHVIDGSVFPSLSSKNLSFTIMANAMRVAARVRDELG